MPTDINEHHVEKVALLAEGVDRNLATMNQKVGEARRPPRGGRG